MDHMKFETPDLTAQNIEKIAALFPGCVTEGPDGKGGLKKAVNFELLRQMLSDDVLEGDEAYEFTWVGKKVSIVEANKPIRKTLRPCPEESKNWDTTENLYIEGDNLEVLKLLQEAYLGKVKMIYIDPPYNTGHDFIYNDRFEMDKQEYDQQIGLFDEKNNRLLENTGSNGRFHSVWCSMIYSRLMLARNLLADDGAIFIIAVNGNPLSQVDVILDFGPFYRFLRTGKKALTYPKSQVELLKNCLTNQKQAGVFEYFKETAAAVSLVAEGGLNILSAQYERIKSVSDVTVLSCYLDSSKKPAVRALPEAVIYPFGLNQSQKTAVENALSSQVSIIQGPPGTGKTQTILNIISNAVRNGHTVAVVSNNNSATLNVAEKLEKKGLSFLTAFLGSRANKEHFLEAQTGQYPDMSAWVLEQEEKSQLDQEITVLSKELSEMLNAKNRIAAIEQELLQLTPEQHYFSEYYNTYAQAPKNEVKGLSSQKILSLWLECEQHARQESKLGLLQKISILFRFNRSALKVFLQTPELVIPYLQRKFYVVRRQELTEERAQLEKKLEQYAFDEKMAELTEKSLRLFQAELSERFDWRKPRRRFEIRDFRGKSREFNREYPVILSTTYSIKGTLNFEHIYDYT